MVESSKAAEDVLARRSAVQQRLMLVEEEVTRLRQELRTLGVAQRLPGLYLTVEVSGTVALLASEAVLEVVRLVACEPLPGAAPHVAGLMMYRGVPAVVVDLAVLLGVKREPDLDAHLVVCAGSRLVALLVDRVRDLVESPMLVDGSAEGSEQTAWDATGLIAGLCRTEGGLRPLLRASALLTIPEEL